MRQPINQPAMALITPSYAPDFERCKLLTESVERCLVGNYRHYIVVDQRDVALFKQLTSAKITLLVVEDIIPAWIFRAPGIKKWWISLRTLPIRNWILQQLVKMSIFDAISEDIAVFCDSDNTFIRPFDMGACLLEGDKLALLKVELAYDDIYRWIASGKTILGIEGTEVKPVTYVSNMISWHRSNVMAMRDRIEQVHGTHWIRAVCQHRTISEYMIYGIFVEYVLGLEAANHFIFNTELIKPSWSKSLVTQTDVDSFFGELKESHVGVMIHSKDNIPSEIYRDKVAAFWRNA